MSTSLISTANAIFRYYESHFYQFPILEDVHSVQLAGSFKRISAVVSTSNKFRFIRNILSPLQTVHCIRHASIDRLFLRELERIQARQVVILGAGLDSRRLRFRDSLNDVAWFEIDQDGQQKQKKHFFNERHPDVDIQFLSRDLNHDLNPRFWAEAGLLPELPTIVIAEGLLHYLEPETYKALLESFNFFKKKQCFIFSFITPTMVTSARVSLKFLFRYLQEIPSLFFSSAEMELVLKDSGFNAVEILDLEHQIDQFAPQARNRNMNVSQNVGLATK